MTVIATTVMAPPSVPRLWPGETVVCIASGPSLTPEDVDFVRGKARVIAINTSWQLAPWADVLYACDANWWRYYEGAPAFPGMKYALTGGSAKYGATVLRNTGREGLELDPTGLRTGANSGYQALNLAVHLGAARVVLLGYDMRPGPKGKTHWHGDHPWHQAVPLQTFLTHFPTIVEPLKAQGVEVINCTPGSALPHWPMRPLREVLP